MGRVHVEPRVSSTTEEPQAWQGEGSFRRILVAFDGAKNSWKALRMAVSLAWQHDAELWLLSVEDHLPHFAAVVGEVEEEKEREDNYFGRLHTRAREVAERRGVRVHGVIVPGHTVETILTYAQEGKFDLLVMGGHARGRLWDALVGVPERVSRGASCTVMVVR